MKKLYFIFAITLIMLMGNSFNTSAQAPEGFTYQAEARDGSGKLLTSKALTVKTTILIGSATGRDVWDKNYNVTTDKYGLFSIVVGDAGTETSFSRIDWGAGKYFLNVQIKNGTTWINTGTTQLLSVPYALYAKSAGSAKITEADPVFTGSSWYSTTNNSSNWNTAYNWGNHASAGYLKDFTETDPVFGLSPAKGITLSLIDNWNLAYAWGNHAGLYRPFDWVPAWNDVSEKPFLIGTSPKNGDLLWYDAGTGRFINWTPDYLTSYIETDPQWTTASANYYTKTDMQTSGQSQLHFNNLTNKPTTLAGYGIIDGGLVNFAESNYLYNSKYGVKIQAKNDAQTNVDFVLSPKGYGAILLQQPDGIANVGGNNRGSFAIDLQRARIANTQVASGASSVILGGGFNTASGHMSTVIGNNSVASGNWSIALGNQATASALYTFATGQGSVASGNYSTVIGTEAKASGAFSTAIGYGVNATGDASTAMGYFTTAPSGYEVVTGRYNTNYIPSSTTEWNSTDRLFVVGNGTAEGSLSNALIILKNANTTIGGSLTINGNGTGNSYSFPAGRGTSGQVLKTNADGTTSWAAAGLAEESDPVYSVSLAAGISATNITNWNTTFGWGNHAGLYRPLSYVPSWSEITSNPISIASPSNNQLLRYNSTSTKWENWTPNYLTSFTETDPVVKVVNGIVKSNGTAISAAVSGTDYLAPGQAVTVVTGTAPIVSSGGTTPGISITVATTSAAGSMSAADKTKLDGIAAGAEVNVQPDWNQATTTADDFIKNKPTIPVAADGSETKVSAGTNVTVTGAGTTANPYVVNATGSSSATHAIGESYGGGIVFFVYDNGQHGLISATADQNTGIRWYNGIDRSTGATGDGLNAGSMNTAMIVASQTADSYYANYAAKVCADYSVTVGGITYGDWYFPSKYELNLLYLQKDIIGGFASANYWSSSEYNSAGAYYQYFATGGQSADYKYLTYYVRAVRAF
jgi:hypothetical protein